MNSLARVVKLIAVLATGAAAAGACGASNPLATGSITVTAQFDNVAGLYVGNEVAVLGMPIGSVTRIAPRGSYVEVTMDVDKDIPVAADVRAVTLSTSLLTDRHIELTPPYRGGPTLRDHDVIGLGRTRTPVAFDRVITEIENLSTELNGDTPGTGPVADLLKVGSQITAGNGHDIRAALDALSRALRMHSGDGAHTRETLTGIVENLSEISTAAATNDQTIREFGTGIRQLSSVLNDTNVGHGDTGAKLNDILQETTDLLAANRGALKSTVANSDTLTRALVDYRNQVGEFFDVTPLMLDNIYNTIDQDAGYLRVHVLADKLMFNGQFAKEVCNLLGRKDLGCNTGTIRDYGPDFGMTSFLTAMAGVN